MGKGQLWSMLLSPSSVSYWFWVLGLSNAAYLFDTYIKLRQYRTIKDTVTRPSLFEKLCSSEEYGNSRNYMLETTIFRLVSEAVGQLQNNIVLVSGLLPWLWHQSALFLVRFFHVKGSHEILQSLVFSGALVILSTVCNLPFQLYSTFYIEKKHGFNQQTIGLFFGDLLKSLLLAAAIGGPILAGVLWTIGAAGKHFYIYVWAFLAIVQFFLILIFPAYIQPLFNRFDPLPEGSLRSKIKSMAHQMSFPLTHIYVMDGSKRSSHSNAYFFGLFKDKRIVIFDTLIQQMSEDEICAVLGHELGHWKHSHMLKQLVLVQVHLLLMFFSLGRVMHNQMLYAAFGFRGSHPILIGLLLLQYLLTPCEVFFGLIKSVLSRSHEFEADGFSHAMGHGSLLQSALLKLGNKNRMLVPSDWLYSAMNHSHPPIEERLAALELLQRKGK